VKSKAIFIAPPSNSYLDIFKAHSWKIARVPPVGPIAIASYLHAKGHDVKFIDGHDFIVKYSREKYLKRILDIVDEFKPYVIGVNMLTAAFEEAKRISKAVKERFPHIPLIIGGPHASVEPVLTLKQIPHIDAICIGAGEEVSLDIMDGKDITAIPGLMHRGHIDKFKKRPVEFNIDKYPFLNYRVFNGSFYSAFTMNTVTGWAYKSLGALTARGCPYSCKFCASDWSKPVRLHSPEYVIEMAKDLATYDIDVIMFLDDTMASVKERLYKICEGFIHSKIFWPHTSLRWIGFIRANQVNPEVLKLMKRAGCFCLSIGMESGSDRMLKVINKKATVEMNKQAAAYIKEAGISLYASFMVGIPGETENEMNQTIDFMKNLGCHSKSLGAFRPLPGSPFYRELVNDKKIPTEHVDWSNLGNFSILPKYLFCDVSKERFEKVYRNALHAATSNLSVAVHEDTLLKRPRVVKNIACRTDVKIAKQDNYGPSSLIPYRPPIVLACHFLYAILHFFTSPKLRQQIKAVLNKVIKKDYFKE